MKLNKKSILLLILLLWMAAAVVTAQETPRVALVIGNGDYQELGRLRNPPNDARDMATTLQGLGFTVELLIDADVIAMEEAVIHFGQRLRASRDTTGFFFYAGHGVQHQGENYLIPTGASIGSEVFLRSRSVSAQAVLDTMQSAGNNLNVVVLDACRDNPFGWSRSGQRGLSQVSSQPPGSIIAYATSSGDVSGDGDGRNGVFTTELLRTLTIPGLDISEIFRLTGQSVRNITNGKQVPAVYSQFFDTAVMLPGDTPTGNLLPSTSFSTTPPVSVTTGKELAEVFIVSDPIGAVVTIDGTVKGNTPLFLDKIPVGSILVLEARLGTQVVRKEYRVNTTSLQEVVLKLKQETGNLLILTTEQESELFIDGESIGAVGNGLLRDVPTGVHAIELKLSGKISRQNVTVLNGETIRINPEWETVPFTLGDLGPAGGIIFYDKGSYSDGWRYLEAAPYEGCEGGGVPKIQWEGYGISVPYLSDKLGSGNANTERLVSILGLGVNAAQYCFDLVCGGYDDWFLPSKDELEQIYLNLYNEGMGGYTSNDYWWSSSEYSSFFAWRQNFTDGSQSPALKDTTNSVWAVRAF